MFLYRMHKVNIELPACLPRLLVHRSEVQGLINVAGGEVLKAVRVSDKIFLSFYFIFFFFFFFLSF